jgi:CRISPR-associated endonuclease Cas1
VSRPGSPQVLVAGGYGVRLSVERGHLLVADGVGRERRRRRLARSQRNIRRVVVLGHVGEITLEAVRWCADVGIALVQLDSDGRVLLVGTNPSRTDSRLLRAQAAAAGSAVGVTLSRLLLGAKLVGHADIAENSLQQPVGAAAIRGLAGRLDQAATLIECRDLEAQAANIYFAAWTGAVHCRFARRDTDRVPEHWHNYGVRRSPLNRGASPRNAADPVNALLNYGYALAEAECRLAALAVGLDPGLGVLHTDQKNRDSLALDLLEPLRPVVERHVLRLLEARTFRATDFTETRNGSCRLLPPVIHEVAEQLLPELARAVATPAEAVAHTLAGSSPSQIDLRTPLSRGNTTNTQTRGQRSQHRRPEGAEAPRKTCQQCGADLYGSARKLCPSCWSVTRNGYVAEYRAAQHRPPKRTPPTVTELSGGWTFEQYQTEILPRLADIPLPVIEKATGLSNGSCSRLRHGLQVPNPKHWPALAGLASDR